MQVEQQPPKELTSWKEIGVFLGVSARTAQKWEQERGLPVRRLAGAKGRVSANPQEIEAWKEKNQERLPWHSHLSFLRYYGAIVSALLILAVGIIVGGYLAGNHLGPPETYRLDHKTLIVMDAAGREIWRKVFEDPFQMPTYRVEEESPARLIWFGDIDGDHCIETLFVYLPVTREKLGSQFICFSDKGKEKWRYMPNKEVSDLAQKCSAYQIIADFRVADLLHDGTKGILITSHHVSSDPNRFVLLDSKGTILGEYWHAGHQTLLDSGDLDGDGVDEIFLGGINNGCHAATVVVLDPRHVTGASTQPAGDKSQIQEPGRGSEKAVILFPRTCINKKLQEYNFVYRMALTGDQLKVDVGERMNEPNREVIYYLDRNYSISKVEYSDLLADLHHELESKGELDHHLSEQEIKQLEKGVIIRRHGSTNPLSQKSNHKDSEDQEES